MDEETVQWVTIDDERATISWYAQQLDASSPPLSLEQERALLARLAVPGCDQQAIRQRLIEGTLGSVLRWTKGYRGMGIPLTDLVAQGNLVLVQAGQAFVPAPNRLFRSYASVRIHQALYRLIVENTHGLHSPSWAKEALYKLNRISFRGIQAVGLNLLELPDYQAVGLAAEQLATLRHLLEPPLSLDAPTGEHEATDRDLGLSETESFDGHSSVSSSQTLLERIAAQSGFDHEEEYARMELREVIQQALMQLTSRERQAIRLRYGFDEGELGGTQKDVGRLLGCTPSRVGQLLEQGERKLRGILYRMIRPDVRPPTEVGHRSAPSNLVKRQTATGEARARAEAASAAPLARPKEKSTDPPEGVGKAPSPSQAGGELPWRASSPPAERSSTARSTDAAESDTPSRTIPPFHVSSFGRRIHPGWPNGREDLARLFPHRGPGLGHSTIIKHLLAQMLERASETSGRASQQQSEDGGIDPLGLPWTDLEQDLPDHILHIPQQPGDVPLDRRSTGKQRSWETPPSPPSPLRHPCRISALAWSPDSRYVALIDERGCLTVYDLASSLAIHTYHQHVPALPLCCWSPDGSYLLSATPGPGIWVRDVATKAVKLYYQGHRHPIRQLAWSPDGSCIVSADRSTVHLFVSPVEREGRSILKKALRGGEPLRLAWSPSAAYLALVTRARGMLPLIGHSAQVEIWDVQSRQSLRILHPEEGISDVAWSPDGRFVATVGKSIRVWSAHTGQLVASGLDGDKGGCWIRWTGDTLFILSRSGRLNVLHAMTGVELAQHRIPGGQLACAAWSPDGNTLAWTGPDKSTVSFWQVPGV